MSWDLDHLAVAATSLEEGAAWIEAELGVAPGPGGSHAAMGTHNRLLSLGPDLYLEVIAVDPAAPAPGRPRWFDLDRFAERPQLVAWVVRTDDLDAALAAAPAGSGIPMDFARGPFRWRMAVPADGRLPLDGVAPALIEWQGAHPAAALPEAPVRLVGLTVSHPRAGELPAVAGVRCVSGPAGLRAEFDTPLGRRVLG